MTPPAHPYLRLRTPVIISVLMLAGGIALVAGSRHLLATAENRARSAAQALADVERRLVDAERTAHLAQEALARHAQMRAAGFDRPADRVSWIEQIETLRKTLPVVQLDYEIGPDHLLETSERGADGPPPLFASTLHLHAGVPHEDAFLALIHHLRQASPSLRPTRCQLSRQTPITEPASLSVRCDVDWIHVRFSPPDAASASSVLPAIRR